MCSIGDNIVKNKLPRSSGFLKSTFITCFACYSFLTYAAENPHDQASLVHVDNSSEIERINKLSTPSKLEISQAVAAADELLAKDELKVYHGWLKYLQFRTTEDPIRMGAESVEAKSYYYKLLDWTQKILTDPEFIQKMRGVYEWAYLSQIDGTGQPFKISIPTDYDPQKPAGINLYCHGFSGNHMEHSAGYTAHPGRFDIAVLGRARGGWYQMLSERDVIDVLKYVQTTWTTDENQVDLQGGSMGGRASMWYGSRYPDLFACARPTCGLALQSPIENMIQLPVYSVHSDDDPIVPVVNSRGPLLHLHDIGGKVIIEQTTGFGHAAWEWLDGGQRSTEWGKLQVRPDPETVKTIQFTATDGIANGAWWAHVSEWGPEQAAATIDLRVGTGNILYGTLKNIKRLRLDLQSAPFDRDAPMQLSLDTHRTITLPAPLPENVEIVIDETEPRFEEPQSKSKRLHTPGAAAMLYDGTPMLVVYGTLGNDAEVAALKTVAIAAAKSPNTSWSIDGIIASPTDGISHFQNLYGNLPVKSDKEVTEEDIANHHLVLIGTADQNTIVQRMEKQLPVKDEDLTLTTSDNFSYTKDDAAWALIYYNPLAPQKLILWIASDEASFYQPGALLPKELFSHGYGADFVILGPDGTVSTARSFDSNWNWSAAYRQSSVLPASMSSKAGWATAQANLLRDLGSADFGAAAMEYKAEWELTDSFQAKEGVTRYSDLALLNYQNRIYRLELTGTQLQKAQKKVNEAERDFPCLMSANFSDTKLEADQTYTVAFDHDSLPGLVKLLGFLPQDVQWTGISESEAINRYGRIR